MFRFLKENINDFSGDVSVIQDYIAYLVHEIKTQLNSIYSDLEILKMEVCNNNIHLNNAILSTEHLISLVDGISTAESQSGRYRKKVVVRTFGDFDIFVDGKLLEFKNQKAKELFAICIDSCGGEVTMKKAIEKLWEGRNYDDKVKRLYRKAVIYLNSIFKLYGVDYIFTSNRGKCHVNRKELICDYYEVLDGKNIEETLFDGRYMTNYSWSEETCGQLCSLASIHLYK